MRAACDLVGGVMISLNAIALSISARRASFTQFTSDARRPLHSRLFCIIVACPLCAAGLEGGRRLYVAAAPVASCLSLKAPHSLYNILVGEGSGYSALRLSTHSLLWELVCVRSCVREGSELQLREIPPNLTRTLMRRV